MLTTLRKFKEHLDLMEADFIQANINNNQLSKMLHQYEVTVNEEFGGLSRNAAPANYEAERATAEGSFMVFDQL